MLPKSSAWTSPPLSSFVQGRGALVNAIEDEERADRIAAAFALLTAKLEDAATLAANGQGPRSDPELAAIFTQIETIAAEVQTISGALAALLADRPCDEH